MPITPLHFGVIPVAKKLTKGRMSATSFVLTNVVLDCFVVATLLQNEVNEKIGSSQSYGLHEGPDHTLLGAMVIAALLSLSWLKRPGWALGCVIGGASHVLLDALVHIDVAPFWPLMASNPLYLDLMGPLSVALTIGSAVWLLELIDAQKSKPKA